MTNDERETLLGIIRSLMYSENMGDVHDNLNRLTDLAGVPRLEGDYLDGWTDADKVNVGFQQ